ncbi:MAG: methyltransferase domain-containing protein [Vicinamibacterales bacterium]
MERPLPRMIPPIPGFESGAGGRPTPRPQPLAVGLFNDGGDTPDVVSLAASAATRQLLARAGGLVRHAYVRGDWQDLADGPLDAAIAAALASPSLRRVFAEVDLVVVAGDTLAGRPSRHLLAILGAAQHLDLATYLVGAVVGPELEGHEVLAGLTDLSVADPLSARRLRDAGIPHRLVDDALYAAPFLETAARDFTDHLVMIDCAPARRVEFTAALAAVRAAWPGLVADVPLDTAGSALDWAHARANLATASAVLTGGRDGVRLALAAGVPFVVLGAGDEARALVDAAPGYPARAADAALPLDERVAAALEARAWFASHAAARRARSGAFDAFSRLRPSLALGGRDDAWTTPVGGAVDVVTAITPSGGSVLHAGAGQGQLVDALAKAGLRAWGADVARRLDRPDRTRYSKATPMALPFADHVFSTVIASADWLEHLDDADLGAAVAELARVGRDHLILEVSGRPVPGRLAFDERLGEDWWRRRLFLLGFGQSDLADTLVTHGAGPTGGTLLVVNAPSLVCPSCRRVHMGAEAIEPVHAGVLQAAAEARPRFDGRRH